ncbi:hypothetical protein M427DRAFT_321188 [Gonapodya prolifera JEL478]|uniref:Uncharacterized protein n=1 Tax=Gonapodya prolifera (strain JEL478) TaxID=1344416 RepID=A0A139AG17_GONPJ|nr:hypothetical protein M427DRAFT_321188 [Gonapodya prolifera JEL478]|eukprot:KXS15737.1 hypothetical protein M427DRAFT_321188 [Gonapodya prolifera JEL478]
MRLTRSIRAARAPAHFRVAAPSRSLVSPCRIPPTPAARLVPSSPHVFSSLQNKVRLPSLDVVSPTASLSLSGTRTLGTSATSAVASSAVAAEDDDGSITTRRGRDAPTFEDIKRKRDAEFDQVSGLVLLGKRELLSTLLSTNVVVCQVDLERGRSRVYPPCGERLSTLQSDTLVSR